MFELLFLGMILIMGGLLILKVLFLLLGLIFTGVGFFLKIILTVVFCVIFFPLAATVLGVVFSGGFFIVLMILIGLGALVGEKNPG